MVDTLDIYVTYKRSVSMVFPIRPSCWSPLDSANSQIPRRTQALPSRPNLYRVVVLRNRNGKAPFKKIHQFRILKNGLTMAFFTINFWFC